MKIFSLAFLWYIPIISGLLFLYPFVFPITDSQQKLNKNKPGVANIVFKTVDGGQTWQDISEGLPEPVKDDDGVGRNVSFANDNGLYLTDGNGLYHSKPNATAPFWTKEFIPDEHSSITPGKTGIFAYN